MPEPLDVVASGRTLGDDGAWYPTVQVEAEDRPDVADLARVHAVEGVGDLTTTLRLAPGRIVLGVRVTSPVRCAFELAFTPPHLQALAEAGVVGHLLVATTPPHAPERPPWLALDLDGAALRAALQELID